MLWNSLGHPQTYLLPLTAQAFKGLKDIPDKASEPIPTDLMKSRLEIPFFLIGFFFIETLLWLNIFFLLKKKMTGC